MPRISVHHYVSLESCRRRPSALRRPGTSPSTPVQEPSGDPHMNIRLFSRLCLAAIPRYPDIARGIERDPCVNELLSRDSITPGVTQIETLSWDLRFICCESPIDFWPVRLGNLGDLRKGRERERELTRNDRNRRPMRLRSRICRFSREHEESGTGLLDNFYTLLP